MAQWPASMKTGSVTRSLELILPNDFTKRPITGPAIELQREANP